MENLNLHIPVLLRESVDFLCVKKFGTYVDCTFGNGNHSQEILKRAEFVKLICFEKDKQMIDNYFKTSVDKKSVSLVSQGVVIAHSDFADMGKWLRKWKIKSVEGFIFDLGLSTDQIFERNRGFSYQKEKEGPLDMRIDQRSLLTAEQVVKESSQKDLEKIFFGFWGKKIASLIAKHLVEVREVVDINTTYKLAEEVNAALPNSYRRRSVRNPARKTFQALRVFINQELVHLRKGLETALRWLATKGRISIISFHSLEDRVIKGVIREKAFRRRNFSGEKGITRAAWRLVTTKPIRPSAVEMNNNPRSKSAKLWVIERVS